MGEPLSDAQIAGQYDAAVRRTAHDDAVEPRAASASYDAASGRLMVELTSGVLVGIPVAAEPHLASLEPGMLARVRVVSGGAALHWPGEDLHVDLPGLIAHHVRMSAWAPKYLGSRTSPAKADAARANGRKGGRPRRRAQTRD